MDFFTDCVILIYNYKLTGLVSSLLLVGYHLLSVNIVSAFTVIFNSNVVTMLLFGLFIAIGYLFLFDHIFNQLYQSGNTVSTSLKNTFTKLAQPTVWSALFVAITVVVSYLFLRMYFLGMAITGFAIVFSFVVVIVLLHYFVLNNLFNSNYLAKNNTVEYTPTGAYNPATKDYVDKLFAQYTTSINENTLDEAPMAYKSLEDIIDVIRESVDVIDVMKPIYNFKASE